MFYPKLAMTNIGKNRKSYFPYILTCVLTIMMFYSVDAICKNDGILSMPGSGDLSIILNMASQITAVFSAIFLFYTNSFLIKQRKKEFGVYQVLGMDKRNLTKMLLCEMVFTAIVSIGAGLLLGILLGKLIFLILLKIIHFPTPLTFAIEPDALVEACVLFGAIFAATFVFNLLQLRKVNPVDLLRGGNVGEREPKTKWLLTLIGVVTMAVGYAIAIVTESPLSALTYFLVAVILVIIGTYALFTAGSIALLKLLKKRKNFYYKSNHFATVSGMLYRMKQNAVGLANICIMSTIVLVLVSVTVALYTGMEDILSTRFPREYHIRMSAPNEEKVSQMQQIVEEELLRAGMTAENKEETVELSLPAIKEGESVSLDEVENYAASDVRAITFTTLECYNAMENKNETLEDGEILLYSQDNEFEKGTVTFGETGYRVKKHLDSIEMEEYDTGAAMKTVHVVVPDMEEIYSLADTYAYEGRNTICYHYYMDMSGETAAREQVAGAIHDRGVQIEGTYFEWKESSRQNFYELYGGFLFIGVFVGLLFLMGTVLIIYYKQISEGLDDRERFQIMRKVGMSRKEVKRTIHSQVLTVFFLPLGAAVIHVAVAFKVLTRLLRTLNLTNVRLEAVCTIGTVLVFSVFYLFVYMITSREYYKIVR